MAKQRSAHICNYPGCTSPAREYYDPTGRFKGYRKTCDQHHGFTRRGGPLNASWKGGRRKNKDGYVFVLDPRRRNLKGASRYILEHRLIAEQKVGRPLRRNEIVHHLNGIRDDNRLENLAIIEGPNGHETWTYHRALQARIQELEARLALIAAA